MHGHATLPLFSLCYFATLLLSDAAMMPLSFAFFAAFLPFSIFASRRQMLIIFARCCFLSDICADFRFHYFFRLFSIISMPFCLTPPFFFSCCRY